MLCAVVVVAVTHVPLQLASKPLEMVKNGGRHQYWPALVGTTHKPYTMRTIAALLLVVSASHAFVAPPPLYPKIPSDAFVRDAEIKHGRIALVSGAVLVTLASAGIEHPTAALAQSSIETQIDFFSAIGIAEAATYIPRLSSMFSLRDGVVSGRLITGVNAKPELLRIELDVSRCAMLAVFFYLLYDVYHY